MEIALLILILCLVWWLWQAGFVFPFNRDQHVNKMVSVLEIVYHQSFDLTLSTFSFNTKMFRNISLRVLTEKPCPLYANAYQNVLQILTLTSNE